MATVLENALSVISYPSLAANSRQAAIISANLEGEQMSEQDLIRVRTPLGGGTQWSIDANGNVETVDEIVGVLVAVAKRGTLWPQEDPSDSRPVIVSNDLRIGYRVGDDLGTIDPAVLEKYRVGDRQYDWVALALSNEFGFGSSRSGSGKRCKESRILAILRDGETWPILVTVGPGSLRNVLPFLKRLPVFCYETVVGMKLTKAKGKAGQPYSQIVPRIVGRLSEEEGEAARRTYYEPLKAMFGAPPMGVVIDADAATDE